MKKDHLFQNGGKAPLLVDRPPFTNQLVTNVGFEKSDVTGSILSVQIARRLRCLVAFHLAENA
jgi:hypothetical protein